MKTRVRFKTAKKVLSRLDPVKHDKAVGGALEAAAKGAEVDFNVTTQTWRHKPAFEVRRKPGKREVQTGDKVYFFLNKGTRIRYATMSPGFRPKSRVRGIKSLKGKGGMIYVSRKKPRPGIKAREWDAVIGEKWQKRLPQQVQRAIRAIR